jgi:glycosyltransferase involved in cell wall biosynthesis
MDTCVGVVAIGRNEGERLRACLTSALRECRHVIYVDSGSTDGSVELARSMGAAVVELDLSVPFTAARARNEGFERLMELATDVEFVQFVDGDCEIVEGWIARATQEMIAKSRAAVVCGRRRERFPNASIYNKLCDMEWETPVGSARACGGDALIRVSAFRQVNGYDPSVIAGEEPEMCFRLRAAGREIWRIDAEMTLHDAAMTRLSQWWTRNVRAGHAYAEGYAMHGRSAERYCARQVSSNWIWGTVLPAACFFAMIVMLFVAPRWSWISVLPLLLLYPLLAARVAIHRRRRGATSRDALVYGCVVTAGKFAQASGQLRYVLNKRRGRRATIIEYKNADRGTPTGAVLPAK